MGKHGKNTTGRAEKLKAKARAKRKLLKKAQARVPARPPKPAAKAMDVDAFLAGDHLAAPADAPDDGLEISVLSLAGVVEQLVGLDDPSSSGFSFVAPSASLYVPGAHGRHPACPGLFW